MDNILLLIKLDSANLFNRLKFRRIEYLRTLSVKRTRSHFADIFRSQYWGIKIEDFRAISAEVIVTLDKFYTAVDDLKWYLNHTEDMPQTVEDKLDSMLASIEEYYLDLESSWSQDNSEIVPAIPPQVSTPEIS